MLSCKTKLWKSITIGYCKQRFFFRMETLCWRIITHLHENVQIMMNSSTKAWKWHGLVTSTQTDTQNVPGPPETPCCPSRVSTPLKVTTVELPAIQALLWAHSFLASLRGLCLVRFWYHPLPQPKERTFPIAIYKGGKNWRFHQVGQDHTARKWETQDRRPQLTSKPAPLTAPPLSLSLSVFICEMGMIVLHPS